MHLRSFTTLLALSFMIAACSVTNSDNVKIDGIYAVYEVEDNGTETEVKARFFVGDNSNGTVLELSNNDSITVNGKELRREKSSLTNEISYKAKLNLENSYVFRFSRTGSEESSGQVLESFVSLPGLVKLSNPTDGATYSRGVPIRVQWQPGRDNVEILVTGEGIDKDTGRTRDFNRRVRNVEDDGSHFLPNQLTSPDYIEGSIFNFRVEVIRTREGEMANKLRGSITATTREAAGNMTLQP